MAPDGRTPFSGTRALQTDRSLPEICKNIAWIKILKQDIASAKMGIMRRAQDVEQYPQAQPDRNRGREEEKTDQNTVARGAQ